MAAPASPCRSRPTCPRPHTPFQLEPFAGEATLQRRQQPAAQGHAARRACVVPRGGAVRGRGHAGARRPGQRPARWSWPGGEARASTAGRSTSARTCGRPRRSELGIELGGSELAGGGEAPWDAVWTRASPPAFFADELERGRRGELTEDCRDGACARLRRLRRRHRDGGARVTCWLVTFARSGPARYLSHLDTARALQRTFARAGYPSRSPGHAPQTASVAAAAAARRRGRA